MAFTANTHPHIHLFIHRENQTILWNVIRRSPVWDVFATTGLRMSTEQWFREMIERKYTILLESYNSGTRPIHPDPLVWLRETNKDMLRQLTASMTSFISPELPPKMQAISTSNALGKSLTNPLHDAYLPSNAIIETPSLVYSAPRNYDIPSVSAFDVEHERKEKQEKAKREFEAYQSQYNSLLVRNVPTAPVFSENIQMDKIKNMEELLKQQREARDRDAQVLVSSEPLPAPENAGFSRETSGSFVDRDNIKQEVMNVFLQNTQEGLSPINGEAVKKSVSWEANT